MKRYCIIGYPVRYSLSPKFYNAAFKKAGIRARYVKEEVRPTDLAKFMRGFRKKYSGASVTMPHKIAIVRYLDAISPDAQKIGAVNVILNKKRKLTGFNTDAFGAIQALKRSGVKNLRRKRATVLGAGGAARAIIYGLKKAGVLVTVLNRTPAHAKKLGREFKCRCGILKDFDAANCDILINATSVGMGNFGVSPLPDFLPRKRIMVMDIITRPRITKLLRAARSAGCRIITGEKMFLAQAERAFKIWTGRKISPIISSEIPIP